MKIDNSKRYKSLAEQHIAHAALTNSKRPSCFVEGIYPTHLKSAYKSTVTDVDGNTYLDFICGLGTNLFGYGNYEIATVVANAAKTGAVHSLPHIDEVNFAKRFCDEHPWIDKLRLLKSGSGGCSAAVRIARAFTGKRFVVSEGYHGWHDGFLQCSPPAKGVAFDHSMIKLDRFKKEDLAAIIIEPIITDYSEERIAWLHEIRQTCDKYGIILIFDETITAYRYKQGSVARAYNVNPDLWVGGKAVAGGLPLSVVGGRADVMEADYFVSSTWAGDRLAIAAADKSIDFIHGDFVPDDLWENGKDFLIKFNEITENAQIEGYPTRGVFKYRNEQYKALFMQEMCRAGILIGPSWFYNKWLHAEIENVISITRAVVRKIERGDAVLQGKMPLQPFAERVRQ